MITMFLCVNAYEGPAFILAVTAIADAIIVAAICTAYVLTHTVS